MLKAERVGHGYRTLEDRDLYKKLLAQNMHFEVRGRHGFLRRIWKKKDCCVSRQRNCTVLIHINTDIITDHCRKNLNDFMDPTINHRVDFHSK